MDLLLKFLILGGKYLTRITSQSIVEAYRRSVIFGNRLNACYEQSLSVTGNAENMLEFYNNNLSSMEGNDQHQLAFISDDHKQSFELYLFDVESHDSQVTLPHRYLPSHVKKIEEEMVKILRDSKANGKVKLQFLEHRMKKRGDKRLHKEISRKDTKLYEKKKRGSDNTNETDVAKSNENVTVSNIATKQKDLDEILSDQRQLAINFLYKHDVLLLNNSENKMLMPLQDRVTEIETANYEHNLNKNAAAEAFMLNKKDEEPSKSVEIRFIKKDNTSSCCMSSKEGKGDIEQTAPVDVDIYEVVKQKLLKPENIIRNTNIINAKRVYEERMKLNKSIPKISIPSNIKRPRKPPQAYEFKLNIKRRQSNIGALNNIEDKTKINPSASKTDALSKMDKKLMDWSKNEAERLTMANIELIKGTLKGSTFQSKKLSQRTLLRKLRCRRTNRRSLHRRRNNIFKIDLLRLAQISQKLEFIRKEEIRKNLFNIKLKQMHYNEQINFINPEIETNDENLLGDLLSNIFKNKALNSYKERSTRNEIPKDENSKNNAETNSENNAETIAETSAKKFIGLASQIANQSAVIAANLSECKKMERKLISKTLSVIPNGAKKREPMLEINLKINKEDINHRKDLLNVNKKAFDELENNIKVVKIIKSGDVKSDKPAKAGKFSAFVLSSSFQNDPFSAMSTSPQLRALSTTENDKNEKSNSVSRLNSQESLGILQDNDMFETYLTSENGGNQVDEIMVADEMEDEIMNLLQRCEKIALNNFLKDIDLVGDADPTSTTNVEDIVKNVRLSSSPEFGFPLRDVPGSINEKVQDNANVTKAELYTQKLRDFEDDAENAEIVKSVVECKGKKPKNEVVSIKHTRMQDPQELVARINKELNDRGFWDELDAIDPALRYQEKQERDKHLEPSKPKTVTTTKIDISKYLTRDTDRKKPKKIFNIHDSAIFHEIKKFREKVNSGKKSPSKENVTEEESNRTELERPSKTRNQNLGEKHLQESPVNYNLSNIGLEAVAAMQRTNSSETQKDETMENNDETQSDILRNILNSDDGRSKSCFQFSTQPSTNSTMFLEKKSKETCQQFRNISTNFPRFSFKSLPVRDKADSILRVISSSVDSSESIAFGSDILPCGLVNESQTSTSDDLNTCNFDWLDDFAEVSNLEKLKKTEIVKSIPKIEDAIQQTQMKNSIQKIANIGAKYTVKAANKQKRIWKRYNQKNFKHVQFRTAAMKIRSSAQKPSTNLKEVQNTGQRVLSAMHSNEETRKSSNCASVSSVANKNVSQVKETAPAKQPPSLKEIQSGQSVIPTMQSNEESSKSSNCAIAAPIDNKNVNQMKETAQINLNEKEINEDLNKIGDVQNIELTKCDSSNEVAEHLIKDNASEIKSEKDMVEEVTVLTKPTDDVNIKDEKGDSAIPELTKNTDDVDNKIESSDMDLILAEKFGTDIIVLGVEHNISNEKISDAKFLNRFIKDIKSEGDLQTKVDITETNEESSVIIKPPIKNAKELQVKLATSENLESTLNTVKQANLTDDKITSAVNKKESVAKMQAIKNNTDKTPPVKKSESNILNSKPLSDPASRQDLNNRFGIQKQKLQTDSFLKKPGSSTSAHVLKTNSPKSRTLSLKNLSKMPYRTSMLRNTSNTNDTKMNSQMMNAHIVKSKRDVVAEKYKTMNKSNPKRSFSSRSVSSPHYSQTKFVIDPCKQQPSLVCLNKSNDVEYTPQIPAKTCKIETNLNPNKTINLIPSKSLYNKFQSEDPVTMRKSLKCDYSVRKINDRRESSNKSMPMSNINRQNRRREPYVHLVKKEMTHRSPSARQFRRKLGVDDFSATKSQVMFLEKSILGDHSAVKNASNEAVSYMHNTSTLYKIEANQDVVNTKKYSNKPLVVINDTKAENETLPEVDKLFDFADVRRKLENYLLMNIQPNESKTIDKNMNDKVLCNNTNRGPLECHQKQNVINSSEMIKVAPPEKINSNKDKNTEKLSINAAVQVKEQLKENPTISIPIRRTMRLRASSSSLHKNASKAKLSEKQLEKRNASLSNEKPTIDVIEKNVNILKYDNQLKPIKMSYEEETKEKNCEVFISVQGLESCNEVVDVVDVQPKAEAEPIIMEEDVERVTTNVCNNTRSVTTFASPVRLLKNSLWNWEMQKQKATLSRPGSQRILSKTGFVQLNDKYKPRSKNLLKKRTKMRVQMVASFPEIKEYKKKPLLIKKYRYETKQVKSLNGKITNVTYLVEDNK